MTRKYGAHRAAPHRVRKRWIVLGACLGTIAGLGLLAPAVAQETIFVGPRSQNDVIIDLSALDALGPPPTVAGALRQSIPQGQRTIVLHPPGKKPAKKTHAKVEAKRKAPAKPVAKAPKASTSKMVEAAPTPAPTPVPAPPPPATASAPQPLIPAPKPEPSAAVPAAPPASAMPSTEPSQPPAPTPVTPTTMAAAPAVTPPAPTPPAPPPPAPPPPEPPAAAPPPPAAAAVPATPSPPPPPPAAVTETPTTPPPAPTPPPPSASAPSAPPQIASKPPAPAIPAAPPVEVHGDRLLSVDFPAGIADLPEAAHSEMGKVIDRLKKESALRVQLLAYAAGGDDQASQARRLSLSRALAVRKYLMDQGIGAGRIDVRALGNKVEGAGPADRVDLVLENK